MHREPSGVHRVCIPAVNRLQDPPKSQYLSQIYMVAPIVFKNPEYPRMRAKGPENAAPRGRVFARVRGCALVWRPQTDRSGREKGPQTDRSRRGAQRQGCSGNVDADDARSNVCLSKCLPGPFRYNLELDLRHGRRQHDRQVVVEPRCGWNRIGAPIWRVELSVHQCYARGPHVGLGDGDQRASSSPGTLRDVS